VAFVIGEEPEASLVKAAQEHHARRRLARSIAGGDRHRLGQDLASGDGIREPRAELL
jgi:hypothetical protein